MLHQVIETLNARVALRSRYDNFIGGKWVAPVDGQYFDNISPITGKSVCQIARSQAADIELALDAAHKARDAWGKTSPASRAAILNKLADRMEENLKVLAAVETIDNGKPIRETSFADIPLAIDHFRYFAACIRAQEGSLSDIDHDTIAYHYHEPLGVVGQIIPWNFPSSWRCGSSRPLSPPAIAWCSNPQSRRPCQSWCSWTWSAISCRRVCSMW